MIVTSGAGGRVASLGYDSQTRLTPLTVNLGEFAAHVNAETREVLQFGEAALTLALIFTENELFTAASSALITGVSMETAIIALPVVLDLVKSKLGI